MTYPTTTFSGPDLYETYASLRGIHYGAINAFAPDSVKGHFKQTLQDNIATGQAQTSKDIYLAMRARAEFGKWAN